MEHRITKIVKIIPTYNEKENIVSLVPAIFKVMPQAAVLVVDDDSPDGTAEAVRELGRGYQKLSVHQRTSERGFGRSYLDGFKKVMGDNHEAIVMMDADFSHDPAAVPAMIEKLADYEVVIGSRYTSGGGIKNWSWRRRLLSRFANYYAKLILNSPVSDLTTGFMCLQRSALDKIDLDAIRSEGYSFLIELKYRLIKAGCSFHEHPIIFDERREGQSKMSAKVIWEAIWTPWRIRF